MVVNRRGLRRTDVRIADLVEGPVSQPAVPGNNLVLTLDMDLQRIVERALRGSRAAAAVFLDVETGRILALRPSPASTPIRCRAASPPRRLAPHERSIASFP